ncbi:MAG: hypothetical protein IT200_02405 [Thermoleophilia bacterium]|nr:hypothetical protein [Thermoleophilia bacterium]
MQTHDFVIMGAEGAPRTTLEETVRRLGHHATSNEPAELRGAPVMGDVLIVDLRDDAPVWDEVTEELLHDDRPLIIVADRPRKLVSVLAGRAAGTLLLTGSEDDCGYRVALTLAAALAPRRRTVAPRTSGWASAGLRTAAAQ